MSEPSPLDWPAYPELAKSLRACADAILARWIKLVAGRLVSADRLTHTQLRDHVPVLLEALAAALESEGIEPFHAMASLAANHGSERFHESYSVDDLLVEFGMLRPIVLDELATTLARRLLLDELASLNHGLDAAMRHSVKRFVDDQSRKIQAVNETHSKYLAYMSHDLRGGLNGVMLTADLLTRSLRDDETAHESVEDLRSMRGSIQETMQAMDAFLQGERLRHGHFTPSPVRSNLGDLVRRAVAQFPIQASRRGVKIESELESNVITEVDRELLNLILTNVLSNGFKHSPAGSTLRVVLQWADENRFARISIIDQGTGISPQRQVGLFRTPSASTTPNGPVGTGLLVASQAAEMIGVHLSVDSVPNAGATFHVVVPIQ